MKHTKTLVMKGVTGKLQHPRGVHRSHVTDLGWEKVFELLLRHNLIEVSANYYEEYLPFHDPNQLEKIFTKLEENNLFSIGRVAEIVQFIEKEEQREIKLKTEDGNLARKLVHTHKDIVKRIKDNRKKLFELINANNFTGFIEHTTEPGRGRMQGQMVNVERVVDVDAMIADLRKLVIECHICSLENPSQGSFVEGNPPLELL